MVRTSPVGKVHETRAGDHFNAWFGTDTELEQFRRRLRNFFNRKGWDHATSEELTQDVLIRAIKKFQNGFEEGPIDRDPKRYLFRVAGYVHLEWLKKRHEHSLKEPDRIVAATFPDKIANPSFLDQALESALAAEERQLLLRYYDDPDPKARILLAREWYEKNHPHAEPKAVEKMLNALRVHINYVKGKLIAAIEEARRS